MDLNELAKIIQNKMSDFEFVKECGVSHYTTHSKNREFYFYHIRLKGFSDEKSSLGFVYNPDEKRIDHVKADLKKDLVLYSGAFLSELENLAKNIGCNQLRTLDKNVFERGGNIQFKYPDGSYRKNLRPQDN